ncbi:MAG TPA: hypothetical protein VEL07_08480 [Planctomycetota bacterium]|nr:hypothetical protein [Planctomycetota bacterium]
MIVGRRPLLIALALALTLLPAHGAEPAADPLDREIRIEFDENDPIESLNFVQHISGLTIRIGFPDDSVFEPITVRSEAITIRAVLDEFTRQTGTTWRQDERGVILVEMAKTEKKAADRKKP